MIGCSSSQLLAKWTGALSMLAAVAFAASSSPASVPAPDSIGFMVFFDREGSQLSAAATRTLVQAGREVNHGTYDGRVVVSGHADSVERSVDLSNARALAVREKLAELGISRERFSIESWGNKKLITAEVPARDNENRRVEIWIFRACIPNCPQLVFSGSSRD